MRAADDADELARLAEAVSDPLAYPPRRERGCPSPERLAELAAGELAQEEREALADHLMLCPDCVAELRVLRRLEPWSREASAALATAAGAPSRRWLQAAAAGLAAALLGVVLGWLLGRQPLGAVEARLAAAHRDESAAAAKLDVERRRGDEAERSLAAARERLSRAASPIANVPVLDLAPEGSLRGGEPSPELTAPAAETPVVLLLAARAHAPADRYALTLRGPDGQLRWRLEGLRPSPYDTFTVVLPAGGLAPGGYRLELLAARGAEERVLERYALRLVPPR